MRTTELYYELQKRYQEVNRILLSKEEEMKKTSDGTIRMSRRGPRQTQFYLKKNEKYTYVSIKDEKTIRKYLQKLYDEKIVSLLKTEKDALEKFEKTTNSIVNELRNIYSNFPDDVKKYLSPIDIPDEEYAKNWNSMPYEGKPVSDTVSIYFTDKGERVRSKSELNIANALYKNNIPYKYECPLILKGGLVIYPDFTVLDVKRRRTIYWEHRGMMDDRDYSRHSVTRIKDYMRNGIYIGDNLIITEETSQVPLGTDEIKNMISHCFM
ncbi:MAG: hypothetical protein MJ119_01870 [Lachnospiraceae bacterium]|nr:hypothetical protein [Lachnospiraceae bacterium]